MFMFESCCIAKKNMYIRLIILTILAIGVAALHGLEGPKVAPFSSHVKPVIGGKTSFICQSLSGSSPLQIIWFKDGKELVDTQDIKVGSIQDSSVLIFDSIKSSHTGNYTCKISNKYGSDSYTTELLIEGPPNWIKKPNNVKSSIHRRISIDCLVSGYPQPTMTWKRLQGSSWTKLETNGQHNHNLQIMNATKSHEGRYGCSASNGIEPNLWSEFDISIEATKFKLGSFT
ncbi:Down syndrome cell adhesion molecule-like protein Dscam2 isoform X2 [Tetranychus urticae]|uniref:Down syndrome cell adhesion molecule-like protein Dscam2 isoform X2 n=1 Tax=Tetranychus urticae TaxID=32264 RepID=UPI00077BDF9E|nr:Down syndrome cell adhesion molecule-like protein Dscam2 isoform X2 [Tetranychus urticae]